MCIQVIYLFLFCVKGVVFFIKFLMQFVLFIHTLLKHSVALDP